MEMALNTGTFKALDQNELYDVEGGIPMLITAWAIGYIIGESIKYTFKLGYQNGYYSTK